MSHARDERLSTSRHSYTEINHFPLPSITISIKQCMVLFNQRKSIWNTLNFTNNCAILIMPSKAIRCVYVWLFVGYIVRTHFCILSPEMYRNKNRVQWITYSICTQAKVWIGLACFKYLIDFVLLHFIERRWIYVWIRYIRIILEFFFLSC